MRRPSVVFPLQATDPPANRRDAPVPYVTAPLPFTSAIRNSQRPRPSTLVPRLPAVSASKSAERPSELHLQRCIDASKRFTGVSPEMHRCIKKIHGCISRDAPTYQKDTRLDLQRCIDASKRCTVGSP